MAFLGPAMDTGFDTIGNATLICYDRSPFLATDSGLDGNVYFGSWILKYPIPEEQFAGIGACPYI